MPDINLWYYGVFVREDVGKTLGIDPTSIKTSEELLDFMLKARDYGFKDVNGNDCIVATTCHNGWDYDNYAYILPIPRRKQGVFWKISRHASERTMAE